MSEKINTKTEKQFINSLNIAEYKKYVMLRKGWLEAKKFKKTNLISRADKNSVNNITEFFIIYKSFLPILKTFKNSNSIKLYIYCGIRSDYETGYFKADYKKISKIFKCKMSAIYKWLNELTQKDLIFIKKYNDENYIFIRPYGVNGGDICKEEYSIEQLSEEYIQWIKKNKECKVLFFVIHSRSFMENIFKLSAGAVKLYLYCGLSMNKRTGTLTRSLNTIGSELGDSGSISLKTLCNQFKELKESKLVEKQQLKFNRASTIYIRPSVDIKELLKYQWILEVNNLQYVGNYESKKVHIKTCVLATKISKKNRRFFSNLDSAKQNGYVGCNSCCKNFNLQQEEDNLTFDNLPY